MKVGKKFFLEEQKNLLIQQERGTKKQKPILNCQQMKDKTRCDLLKILSDKVNIFGPEQTHSPPLLIGL